MTEQVNKNIMVKGNVEDIYDLWADFENFLQFMEPIRSVQKTGDRSSHWVVDGPFGQKIEWDAEATTLEKNKRIAWNSTGGDIKTTGQVTFTELPNDQTQVSVILQYAPGDKLAKSIAAQVFDNPEKQLQENLRRFKEYAEEKLKSTEEV